MYSLVVIDGKEHATIALFETEIAANAALRRCSSRGTPYHFAVVDPCGALRSLVRVRR